MKALSTRLYMKLFKYYFVKNTGITNSQIRKPNQNILTFGN